ncbi:MAG: hypothetical protein ABSE82_17180 [Nitrososphaerales archaeon]|jgi:hypothetical protein
MPATTSDTCLNLLEALLKELEAKGRRDLALGCFAHIPPQVELEIHGFRDVYAY